MLQLGPDTSPRRATQIFPMQLPVGRALYLQSVRRVHVAPPGQALVEVRFTDARKGGEPLALIELEGTWDRLPSGHIPHGSDSLQGPQGAESGFSANRYVKMQPLIPSELLELGPMETAGERRRRKLTELCDKHGRAEVAAKSGQNPFALEQIIKGVLLPEKQDGTRSVRSLGDRAARAIETAFGLGEGWFDQPDEAMPLSEQAIAFAIAFEKMTPKERARLERLMFVAMDDTYLGGMSNFGDLPADDKTGTE